MRMQVTMKGAAISRLVRISQLSQDYRHADEKLVDRQTVGLNRIIVDKMEPAAQVALREPFQESDLKSIIMTELKRLGRIPHCDFKRGDEIWIVLGIDYPLVQRPRLNGYYCHVCAAYIPSIQEHEEILNLSSDIQPGDKIGEWVVENIEIE
jgi:hypothetical protein